MPVLHAECGFAGVGRRATCSRFESASSGEQLHKQHSVTANCCTRVSSTASGGVCGYRGVPMMTSQGPVTAAITNAWVSFGGRLGPVGRRGRGCGRRGGVGWTAAPLVTLPGSRLRYCACLPGAKQAAWRAFPLRYCLQIK